jgi:heme/copper-type cytochrome/quinol oxidase subunit 2
MRAAMRLSSRQQSTRMTPTPVLWICAFVVAAVFAVMIHSIATFRRASGSRNAVAEIFWAIVPIFIMVSTALPAVRMLAADRAASTVQAYNADRK